MRSLTETERRKMFLAVSPSVLKDLDKCPRFWYYAYILRRGPRDEEKPKAELGTAGHLGLALYYKGEADSFEAAEAAANYYKPFIQPLIESLEPKEFSRKRLRTPEELTRLLVSYINRYPKDQEPFRTYKNYVEIGFSIPFGDGIVITGRIDRVVHLVDSKELYVMDHKFTGFPEGIIANPNLQFETYAVGLSHSTGEVAHGACVNAIRTYPDREGEWPVVRKETSIKEWRYEEWHSDVTAKIGQILSSLRKGYWEKRTESCYNFGECPYRPLCITHGEAREAIAQHNFEHVEKSSYPGGPIFGVTLDEGGKENGKVDKV